MKPFKEALSGECPICDGKELSLYRPVAQKGRPLNPSITNPSYGIPENLVRCLRCGVVFANPLPSEETLRSLYGKMKDETYLEEEEGRRRMAEESLLLMERFVRPGRLLDVGCFSGFFLDVAQKRGWEGIGIEPSSWARKFAEEKFGLQILERTLKEASFPEATFDAVSLIDTLEHLRDPKGDLLEARRILKPEGVLYLSAPDIGSLAARLLGNRWWGFRQEHLVYFSKKTLSDLLEKVGFVILSRRAYRRVFTIEALLRRLKEMSPWAYRLARPIGWFPSLGRRHLVVNFFDQMEWVARKG